MEGKGIITTSLAKEKMVLYNLSPLPSSLFKEEQAERIGYWKNELESLGICLKRKNELNNKDELAQLVENIKQMYYQDYKTAYSNRV